MAPIDPKNVTAQFRHRARGNPPSTQVHSAISNCYPGLEFDFRNVWKNILVGIELHEAGFSTGGHVVVGVDVGGPAANAGVSAGDRLIAVDDFRIEGRFTGSSGPVPDTWWAMEFGNAFAGILKKSGTNETVKCTFRSNGNEFNANLNVRPVLKLGTISDDLAEPGALTQSLCSPWQADYRECGCFYWAASRPDFVNYDGPGTGHDWMQRDRSASAAYVPDPPGDSPTTHFTYHDLYTNWEGVLKFIIGGKDSE